MTSLRIAASLLVLCLLAAAPRAAAGDDDLQKHLREVVKEFSFEEKHGESVPRDWTKVTSRGYPAYTKGGFDHYTYVRGVDGEALTHRRKELEQELQQVEAGRRAAPADAALKAREADLHKAIIEIKSKLQTSYCFYMNGGNCAYEYMPSRTQVEPDFDYCLEGWIKTEGLKYSQAFLSIWFNDQQSRMIPGSRLRTSPAVGGTSNWTRVEVYLSPNADDNGRPYEGRPRFLGISMEVIGGEVQDIGGQVWFDDIRLYRIPRLRMSLPGNRLLFPMGQAVTLDLSADGLLAKSFPGRLTVHNDHGASVFDEMISLVPEEQGEARRRVTLPQLPPGAYHATYEPAGEGPTVLCRRASFAVLAPLQGPDYLRGTGFGLADATGIDDPDVLADLVANLGPRTLKVRLWHDETTADELQRGNARLERLVNRLRHDGVGFVGVFAKPPQYLSAEASSPLRGVADLLALKEDVWQQPIGFTMSRYAGIITSWQIGGDGDASIVRLQTERGLLEPATRQMDRLTAGMPLGISWPALYALPEKLPERVDFVSLHVGPEILPREIQEYLEAQASEDAPRIYLTLDPISSTGHDPHERIFDFVSRFLAAKRAGVDQIFFSKLVDPEAGLLRSPGEPSELYVVARTLCDMLGGARFAGHLPLEHEAEALVFERDDGSETIVIWKEHGKFPVKEPLYLGEQLRQTDLWGNSTPLPRFGSVSSLTLQPMPVFVTGIDPQISRTRRSFRLSGGRIPSAYRRHQTAIEFTNGFKRGVAGQLRLLVPEGWKVSPQIVNFNLSEGERFVQPLSVTVPYNETVGEKDFRAEFTVEAKATYRFMALARFRFDMATAQTRAFIFQEGTHLVIEQEVLCTAQQPTSYHAYVQIPGRPMMNHYMPKMQPGESLTRRYLLPYNKGLEEKTALVGVRDDTPDRGFANLLLPLGGVHSNAIVRTSSADRPAEPE